MTHSNSSRILPATRRDVIARSIHRGRIDHRHRHHHHHRRILTAQRCPFSLIPSRLDFRHSCSSNSPGSAISQNRTRHDQTLNIFLTISANPRGLLLLCPTQNLYLIACPRIELSQQLHFTDSLPNTQGRTVKGCMKQSSYPNSLYSVTAMCLQKSLHGPPQLQSNLPQSQI